MSKAPQRYSPLGTSHWSEYEPLELQAMLVNAAMNSLRTLEDWQYMGRHALPVCLPPFMAAVQRIMFANSVSASLQGVEFTKDVISMMRPFFTILREFARFRFPGKCTEGCLSRAAATPFPPPPQPAHVCVLCAACALCMYLPAVQDMDL